MKMFFINPGMDFRYPISEKPTNYAELINPFRNTKITLTSNTGRL